MRAMLLLSLGTALVCGLQQGAKAQFMASPHPMGANPLVGVGADLSTFTGADLLRPFVNVTTLSPDASTVGLLRLVDRLAPQPSGFSYGNSLTTSF